MGFPNFIFVHIQVDTNKEHLGLFKKSENQEEKQ